MRLNFKSQFSSYDLSQHLATPTKKVSFNIAPKLKHNSFKRAKAFSPRLTQCKFKSRPLQPNKIEQLKQRSFCERSLLPAKISQLTVKPNSDHRTDAEQLNQAQHIRSTLNQLLANTESFKCINPVILARQVSAINQSLESSISAWSKDPSDFLTRHLLDYNLSLCAKLNHRLERQAKLQDSGILLGLTRDLAATQDLWRHTRYTHESTLANIEPWLQQSSSITRQKFKRALSALTTASNTHLTDPKLSPKLKPIPTTSLGQAIELKQQLGEYLLIGGQAFIKQKGQAALDRLHAELNHIGIRTQLLSQDTPRHLGGHTQFLLSQLLTLGSKAFSERFHYPADKYGDKDNDNNKNHHRTLGYLASEICYLFPEQLSVNHYNMMSRTKPNDPKLKALIDSLRFINQHPAYQQMQHRIDSLTLSRGLPPVLRGNAESLIQQGVAAVKAISINRQNKLSTKWKQALDRGLNKPEAGANTLDTLINMPSKQYHRHQKVRHIFDSAHSIHNHRLMRDIQQQHRNDHASDLVKEKAKLGRGLQSNQTSNTADVTQEPSFNGQNISIAPDAFGLTEAIAGLRSCIHKIKKSRSDFKQLKQQKSGREQARQALLTFSRRPLTEQIEQLPSFYSNILKAHKGKLDSKGLYGMTVDLCDAWLGATRYSANLGINALRMGNHLTEVATGSTLISSSSQALTTASTASSILAFGLSTAKASKNALALKHQVQTLKHYEQAQQQAPSQSELAPLLTYAIKKQHALTPKTVDLLKETLSAGAYGISSGVGLTSIATAGSAVGLGVASGVGAGAAAVAASAALGSVVYHHGRLYRKNQRLEQAAQQWPPSLLSANQQHLKDPSTEAPYTKVPHTKEQQALLKRLPNVIADLLVQDLKREIPTNTLNQVRGEFLALFHSFPKEDPASTTSAEAKAQTQIWIERIKMADSSLLKQMKHSPAAQCLRQIGIEPSVIFGIALSTDSEEQDELSRQLILQYAGLPIIKGKALRFENLDNDLKGLLKN
jgi:hypothetical protein